MVFVNDTASLNPIYVNRTPRLRAEVDLNDFANDDGTYSGDVSYTADALGQPVEIEVSVPDGSEITKVTYSQHFVEGDESAPLEELDPSGYITVTLPTDPERFPVMVTIYVDGNERGIEVIINAP